MRARVGMFLGALALLAAQARATDPSSAQDCVLCHFSWMPAFLDEGRGGDLAAMPSGPMVTDDAMCFSCHDGSVVDSRERVFLEHGHKTGIEPPEEMEVPEILPLDDEGEIFCATCHTAHGVDMTQVDMATAVFLRVPNANSELCRTCHAPMAEDLESRNHPVDVDLEDAWPPELAATLAERGEDHDVICQSCHTPHGSDLNALLVLPIEEATLCAACHIAETSVPEDALVHNHAIGHPLPEEADAEALVELGAHLDDGDNLTCRTCHSPHAGAADNATLLVSNHDDALCLLCHTEKDSVHLTGHRLSETAPDIENAHERTPARAGSCSGCHTPHATPRPMLWAATPDPDAEGEAALCLACHAGGHGEEVFDIGAFTHPTEIAVPEEMTVDDLPLFDAALRPDPAGQIVCSTCHDVHDPRDAGDEPVPEDERAAQSLIADNTGDALCLICHESEEEEVAGGRHDFTDEDADVDEAVAPMGPCSGCHVPHQGQGPRLWAQPPAGEGAMAERLCQGCHGDEDWPGAAPSEIHLHPVTDDASDLDSVADLPLYDTAAVRPADETARGAMTCLTCHAAHTLPRDEDNAARLPLGGQSPLCIACHTAQENLLATDHDLTLHPTSAEEALEINVTETGTCVVCHRFLDDPATGALFQTALAPSDPADAVADLCLTCHRAEGLAGERAIPLNSHPRAVAPPEERRPEHLPLYDAAGHRDDAGQITCTTCHNPHEEPRDDGEEGRGLFLRAAEGDDPALCMDCHRDRRWVAGTDHDLRLTAPEERNTLAQTAAEATLCSACHLAHPPEDVPLLWGHALGEGEDFITRTCTGCHREDGCAPAPSPETAPHPLDAVVLWSPVAVPNYDTEGHGGDEGLVTCATCHNPHQWDGDARTPGPGEATEGDVMTSFLRADVPERLCAWCHGLDSLIRYLHFHRQQTWGHTTLTPWEDEQ